MKKIAHILNPVLVDPANDWSGLGQAQPVAFRSMEMARDFARGQVEVEMLAACFPEDAECVPSFIRRTRPLDRSVLDLGTFQVPRRLPLMMDILQRLHESSDAEFLIYTNADIGLLPHFYVTVDAMLDQGYDAFAITRRTISKQYTRPADIWHILAQAGEKHPGNDCFVFSRQNFEKYVLTPVCIGAQFVIPMFLVNLICHARNYRHFPDLHVTFHLGDDRVWNEDRFQDYAAYNRRHVHDAILALHQQGALAEHPTVQGLILDFAPDVASPELRAFGAALLAQQAEPTAGGIRETLEQAAAKGVTLGHGNLETLRPAQAVAKPSGSTTQSPRRSRWVRFRDGVRRGLGLKRSR